MSTELKAGRRCGRKCEIYSRVCGYHRPVANWNAGKKEEFRERVTYDNMSSSTERERLAG